MTEDSRKFLKEFVQILMWLFIGLAVYIGLAFVFPHLAIYGIVFGVGRIANMALIPCGLVLLTVAGFYLARTRIATLLGVCMVLAATGFAAYSGVQSWREWQAVEARVNQVADLSVERITANPDATLVFLGNGSEAKCDLTCGRALVTRSIDAYVQSYQARYAWNFDDVIANARYREFRRASGEDCAQADAELDNLMGVADLAIYRLAGACIRARDLDQAPDGLWILQDWQVRDQPEFAFEGQLTEIYLRQDGAERRRLHHEAGYGTYRMFPPMLVMSLSPGTPPTKIEWVSADFNYGTTAPIKQLIETATGLSIGQAEFPEAALPAMMETIRQFERDYGRLGDAEKTGLMLSIKALLWQRPTLFAELEPLVLRAAGDTGKAAEPALSILSSRNLPNRETFLPVILKAADNPTAHDTVVRILSAFDTALSEETLLRIARTAPTEPVNESHPYFDLFKLLKKRGEASEAALVLLLSRADYRMNYKAASQLIKLGRQDRVRARAEVFRKHLETYRPSLATFRTRTMAGHVILAEIGMREEAERMIESKFADPSLTDTGRKQLQQMLDQL